MAPLRNKKKAKVVTSENASPPRHRSTESMPASNTPQSSPRKTITRISAAQKQTLIDNLQLEVTERARKLRAQYVLQAQSLHTRIGLRINRIPTALRKANMGELYAKYEDARQGRLPADEESKQEGKAIEAYAKSSGEDPHAAKPSIKGKKRKSNALESDERDKVKIHEDRVPNPKKRAKMANKTGTQPTRDSTTVLSPKSANSRTLPQSPVRDNLGSPQKPLSTRATSPLKPVNLPNRTNTAAATAALTGIVREKTKAGRPKAGPGKQAGARTAKATSEKDERQEGLRTVSSTSNSSALSTGTTIVKPTKKSVPTKTQKGARSKGVVKKAGDGAEAESSGRRVLRKRG